MIDACGVLLSDPVRWVLFVLAGFGLGSVGFHINYWRTWRRELRESQQRGREIDAMILAVDEDLRRRGIRL